MNKEKLKFLIEHKQHYIYIGFAVIFIILLGLKLTPKKTSYSPPEINNSVDTYIPKGFVLVPIQISNEEVLNEIIGSHGFVDLYSNEGTDEKPQYEMLVKNIRLLKSPVDPSIVAVLSPESMVKPIVRVSGKFKIAIKSQSNKKTEFTKLRKKRQSRITIEEAIEI